MLLEAKGKVGKHLSSKTVAGAKEQLEAVSSINVLGDKEYFNFEKHIIGCCFNKNSQMEYHDIDPDEAQKLIKLIEHLLEQWYISRHEQELLYADIIGIDETKQSARKKTE